jgi:hypothetical protein
MKEIAHFSATCRAQAGVANCYTIFKENFKIDYTQLHRSEGVVAGVVDFYILKNPSLKSKKSNFS